MQLGWGHFGRWYKEGRGGGGGGGGPLAEQSKTTILKPSTKNPISCSAPPPAAALETQMGMGCISYVGWAIIATGADAAAGCPRARAKQGDQMKTF
jgi:hypothetical protein